LYGVIRFFGIDGRELNTIFFTVVDRFKCIGDILKLKKSELKLYFENASLLNKRDHEQTNAMLNGVKK